MITKNGREIKLIWIDFNLFFSSHSANLFLNLPCLFSERLPADGASYDDFDEDDGLDGLDDDGMDDGKKNLII